MTDTLTDPLARLRDEHEVIQLAHRERTSRDLARWDDMRAAYHPDARVTVSWFDGPAEVFIDRSREMYESGGRSVHLVGHPDVVLRGDRAVVDTGCTINIRSSLNGVAVETTAFARHRSRAERRAGVWRLCSLYAVYQRDTLVPVVPGQDPGIDPDVLAGFRPSYAFLSYLLMSGGRAASQDLPGYDRPDTYRPLVDADAAWLAQS